MARIRVLDPTARPPDVDADPGPDAGALTGKVVGIRSDRTWDSFEWTIAEWLPRFEAAGATVRVWEPGNRIGDEGETTRRELEDFATDVDLAVVGLGN